MWPLRRLLLLTLILVALSAAYGAHGQTSPRQPLFPGSDVARVYETLPDSYRNIPAVPGMPFSRPLRDLLERGSGSVTITSYPVYVPRPSDSAPNVPGRGVAIKNFGNKIIRFSYLAADTEWKSEELKPEELKNLICSGCAHIVHVAFNDGYDDKREDAELGGLYGFYWDSSGSRWGFASWSKITGQLARNVAAMECPPLVRFGAFRTGAVDQERSFQARRTCAYRGLLRAVPQKW